MTLSPKASCSIGCGPKTETNFDADSLLLEIPRISCKENLPDYAKLTKKKTNKPLKTTISELDVCGTVIHKAYS